MGTLKNIENGRTHRRATWPRIAVSLALAVTVALGAVHVSYARRSPTPPVSKCSDFACQP